MTLVGVLVLVGLFAVGAILVALGARVLRQRRGRMLSALSILLIVVGALFVAILVGALVMQQPPWTGLLIVLASGAVLAAVIFWIGVLADCLLNEPNDGMGKLVWALAIILTFVIGAGIYYFGRRPRRIAEATKQRPA